jgi:hypothetical protein
MLLLQDSEAAVLPTFLIYIPLQFITLKEITKKRILATEDSDLVGCYAILIGWTIKLIKGRANNTLAQLFLMSQEGGSIRT